jgi:hypothetical protein
MIRIFRNIRQKLAAENKAMAYSRYAIGEILLVVIGILIALQVNTWNQERIAKIDEQSILNNIHSEFLENKKSLQKKIEESDEGFQSGKFLMNLVGEDKEKIEKFNIDSLLFNSLESGSYKFSENTISELFQTGRLQLLHNEKLINLIYKWSASKTSSDVSNERVNLKIDNELVPYLQKKYSLKDIDRYGALKWKKKSVIEINKLQIFEDIEFENIMDDYLYRVNGSKVRLLELEIIINAIIKRNRK